MWARCGGAPTEFAHCSVHTLERSERAATFIADAVFSFVCVASGGRETVLARGHGGWHGPGARRLYELRVELGTGRVLRLRIPLLGLQRHGHLYGCGRRRGPERSQQQHVRQRNAGHGHVRLHRHARHERRRAHVGVGNARVLCGRRRRPRARARRSGAQRSQRQRLLQHQRVQSRPARHSHHCQYRAQRLHDYLRRLLGRPRGVPEERHQLPDVRRPPQLADRGLETRHSAHGRDGMRARGHRRIAR